MKVVEQNAPLGRAVIGGLLFATVGTLFIVPVIYSLMKKHAPIDYTQRNRRRVSSRGRAPTAAARTGAARLMAEDFRDDKTVDASHRLPLPEEQRPGTLADEFAYGGSVDDHELASGFERAHDERELGREFEHPGQFGWTTRRQCVCGPELAGRCAPR